MNRFTHAFGASVPLESGGVGATSSVPPYCGGQRQFQQMLKDLGYYPGAIDGKVGSGTLRGAAAFARANGLPTGHVTSAFCKTLVASWEASRPSVPVPMPPFVAPPAPPAWPPAAPAVVVPPTPPASRRELPVDPGQRLPATHAPPPAKPPASTTTGLAKMMTGTNIAIGAGALAALGLLIYVATRDEGG